MKLIEVKLARLHNPILVAGTNLGVTLDPAKKTGLILSIDVEKAHLYVVYNGELSVETTNLSGYIPKNPKDLGINVQAGTAPIEIVKTAGNAPIKRNISHTAQVETPHGLDRSKL